MEFGDVGFPTASSNQTAGPLSVRTSLGGANVRFENWSGTLGGNFQDDDPFEASPAFAAVGGKVEWGAQAPTVLANFTAVGASSRVVAAFTVYSETPGTTFVVERSSQPTGPFTTAAALPCTGALSYVCVDDPLAPGSMYYYRLVEQAPGVSPRVLGVASAMPFAAGFATAPNVFEVGPGFPYATPQAAIDAAILGQVPGAVVRPPPGPAPRSPRRSRLAASRTGSPARLRRRSAPSRSPPRTAWPKRRRARAAKRRGPARPSGSSTSIRARAGRRRTRTRERRCKARRRPW